jgi:hypothetical protein
MGSILFAYREKVVRIESNDPEVIFPKENGVTKITDKALLLAKHEVLRREKRFSKVLREVEAFENLEKLDKTPREPIADSVRLFVWQRDNGQCVKCSSRERLEFDPHHPNIKGRE